MKLYNTLSRTIDEVSPLNKSRFKLFVCGPTVYDLAQIGNAKTYVQFDVLARVLRMAGYEVVYLQNITDIDDKIIARAKEQGVGWDELRDKYESEYKKDMESLGNTAVSQYARATDYIEDIIQQVKTLLDKGHAYKIDDGIYFEIATFKDYGKLSGRTEIKENDAESRIDQSNQKKGWNDFCVWKFSKPDEPVWDAPFGKGRPGWHIEDTAITEHFFGPQYDIHGGAVDLIFPHHEAEITLMESLSGKVPFVKYWMHGGFLTVDGRRMGKSMGNFITIRDVLSRGYDPMALRLLLLQTHYRSESNFTWENLDAAANRLKNLQAFADLRWQVKNGSAPYLMSTNIASIKDALLNDLNTPLALSLISGYLTEPLESGVFDSNNDQYLESLMLIENVLGINLAKTKDITDHHKHLIADREKARQKMDFKKSDELRARLKEQGIAVRDTPHGPIWSRL